MLETDRLAQLTADDRTGDDPARRGRRAALCGIDPQVAELGALLATKRNLVAATGTT